MQNKAGRERGGEGGGGKRVDRVRRGAAVMEGRGLRGRARRAVGGVGERKSFEVSPRGFHRASGRGRRIGEKKGG